MRCLGQITNRRAAEQFVAFLLTQGISTQVEPVPNALDQWEVWVRDEDRMAEAIDLLIEYERDPGNPKYFEAVQQANKVLLEKTKQRQAVAKNVRKVRYQSTSFGDRRIPPLTLTLIILCVVVSIFNNFGNPDLANEIGQSISRQLFFVSSADFAISNGDPAASLKKWQLWRVITPIFLHLSPIHLVFNTLGMVVLGRVCERWLGTTKYALFVLAAAVLPNLLQGLTPEALHGSPFFGGISGVVYALFGLVWIRSMLNPMLGIFIPTIYLVLMIMPIAVGISGIVPGWNFADLCHLGGLLVGAATAFMIERR
jgi:GlpG protein